MARAMTADKALPPRKANPRRGTGLTPAASSAAAPRVGVRRRANAVTVGLMVGVRVEVQVGVGGWVGSVVAVDVADGRAVFVAVGRGARVRVALGLTAAARGALTGTTICPADAA